MADNAFVSSLEPPALWEEQEKALVAAAQKDTAAAGRLFDKYYPEIFRYVYHSTLNHAITEDLTSNVFFCAYRRLGFFQWRRIPFRAWLYRIAVNEVRMHFRRLKGLKFEPVDPEYPASTPSGDANVACQDEHQALLRALAGLPQKYRTVITLRFFEDKSLSEICEITNKREGTVKSLLHRAQARLKERLVEAGVTLR